MTTHKTTNLTRSILKALWLVYGAIVLGLAACTFLSVTRYSLAPIHSYSGQACIHALRAHAQDICQTKQDCSLQEKGKAHEACQTKLLKEITSL